MIKPKLLLLLFCVAALFSSCSQVFSPALYHQDVAYQPKPTSFDTVKDRTYASAACSLYAGANYNDGLESWQLNISRGHLFNHFNLAYGAFGVLGVYDHSTGGQPNTITDFQEKSFGAVGGRFSANLFTTSDNVDFRYIGFEAIYSHEFGDYANFRQVYYQANPANFVDARTDLLTAGLTTEIIFHSRRNKTVQHGFRGFLGTTFGNNNLESVYYQDKEPSAKFFRAVFPKVAYFVTFKNYFASADVDITSFMFRFGLKF